MTTVAIAGASGFLGEAFAGHLEREGHQVRRIGRASSRGAQFHWDLAAGRLDPAALDGADAVVNFAGATVAQRWTGDHKREILASRLRSTEILAKTIVAVRSPPKVFLSTSAIGIYGSRGDEPLDERSAPGGGFLADVVQQWERAAAPAGDAGIRLVYPRLGLVMHPDGGVLAKLVPVFNLGGGGKIGKGTQWMSWIGMHDLVRSLVFLMTTDSLSGPFNISAPNPVTNEQFSRTLGDVLHRPALASVPEFAIKLMFGEMGEETLLSGQRVIPRRLLDADFGFAYPELAGALAHEIRK
ncbi:MAG TPA: TIGR01777 family oxidoreductase [Gemmatimonadaceae bacterium]|nr:TIGR01777 family oxidoreductase [Gemmatimonadaceae bacterium]